MACMLTCTSQKCKNGGYVSDTIVSVLGNNLLNFDKVSQTGHTMLRLKLAS